MKVNHGIVAINEDGEVLHFCGYTRKPTEEDYANLDEELQSDPEFKLIGEDYDLVECPKDLLTEYKEMIESLPEDYPIYEKDE